MKQPTFCGRELLPLSVIEAARAGDPLAVERVLRYYEGYIDKLCTRKLYDLDGSPHVRVDEYMKRRLAKQTDPGHPEQPIRKRRTRRPDGPAPGVFLWGIFYAFQIPFRRGLEQSYCHPVNRLPEARYGGLFSALTA